MSVIEVKNKKGTAGKTPPSGYSSWLEYWERKKGESASECRVYGCNNRPAIGGHVIKSGEGNKEYILPMCYSCNNKPDYETFSAFESDLVSVI